MVGHQLVGEKWPSHYLWNITNLLVVNGGDGLAFVGGGHEDVDQALFGLGVDLFAFEEVINLVVGEAESVFVGFGWRE